MLTNLAFDSCRDQASDWLVLSSSLDRKILKLLSEIFDLDDIDCEIICLIDCKPGIQAKEIALNIYLSRDASRKRAIKLTKKEILKAVRAKERSPGAIQQPFNFYLSSKFCSILPKIKTSDSLRYLHKFALEFSSEKFAYLAKKKYSLEEKINHFPSTRRNVFFLVATLKQATSPLIADKLGIFPQAVRYHLEWLRKDNWIDRCEFTDNPNAYYYFLNTEIDHQLIKSMINPDLDRLESNKKKNNDNIALFEQEIPKLDAEYIELITEICNNPGSSAKNIQSSVSRERAEIGELLRKLTKMQLTVREKDPNFQGVKYLYYPASGLTINTIKQFSSSLISTNINENINMKNLNINGSTSTSSSMTKSSFDMADCFAKLNYIAEQEKQIEQEEKKIQKRKNEIEKIKQEMISRGGKEVERFFLLRNKQFN